jgi:hypothetical protein
MEEKEVLELIRFCKDYPGMLEHLTPEFIPREFKNNRARTNKRE